MADDVFQLRIYHSKPGDLPKIIDRFRQHTAQLYIEHKIDVVGYFAAPSAEDPDTGDFIYICRFPSLEVAEARWTAFRADPRWATVRELTEVNGPFNASSDSTFMTAMEFSPLC